MSYCEKCGASYIEGSTFCGKCGNRLTNQKNTAVNRAPVYIRNEDALSVLNTLTKKMRTSATLWTLLGIYQIFIGLFTLFFGYGFMALAIGIWNLVQSSRQRKNAAYYQSNPVGIPRTFENSKTMTIVFIFVNLFFGAVLGVFGSIYDLTICNYALNHRDEFDALERQVRNGGYHV